MQIHENEKSLNFVSYEAYVSIVNKLTVNEYFIHKKNFLENGVIEVVIS